MLVHDHVNILIYYLIQLKLHILLNLLGEKNAETIKFKLLIEVYTYNTTFRWLTVF